MPVYIIRDERPAEGEKPKRHLAAGCPALAHVPAEQVERVRNTRTLRERTDRCTAGCWVDYETREAHAEQQATPKPANARWVAKTTVSPRTADHPLAGEEHAFEEVEIAWYGSDRIKLTLKGGGPAVIHQVFLPGKGDVILDLGAIESE